MKLNIIERKKGIEINEMEDSFKFSFLYPRINKTKFLEVDLEDVRASDGIRIYYDFEKDGWVIQQPTQLSWEANEEVDYKWKEVAFIKSWQLEKEQENKTLF